MTESIYAELTKDNLCAKKITTEGHVPYRNKNFERLHSQVSYIVETQDTCGGFAVYNSKGFMYAWILYPFCTKEVYLNPGEQLYYLASESAPLIYPKYIWQRFSKPAFYICILLIFAFILFIVSVCLKNITLGVLSFLLFPLCISVPENHYRKKEEHRKEKYKAFINGIEHQRNYME